MNTTSSSSPGCRVVVPKARIWARKTMLCLSPVLGCRAKPQVWLALHFNTTISRGERRRKLLNDSIRLDQVPGGGKPKLPRQKDQPTLHQLRVTAAPEKAWTACGKQQVMGELRGQLMLEFPLFSPRRPKPYRTVEISTRHWWRPKIVDKSLGSNCGHQQIPVVSFADSLAIMLD